MELSNEQKLVLEKFLEGQNVFLTGPGGTGKTELIKLMKENAILASKKIQICALTGCAAVLLNCKAKTVHSWSGIGLGNGTIESNVNKIINNIYKSRKWIKTDILIIDEVSMLSMKLFEMLDAIGKAVKKNSRPFGGIQLVFSGDFYQLPPVGNNEDINTTRFCFESLLWNETFPNHIELTKIFRQKDPIFTSILNEIREGKLSKTNRKILKQHINKSFENNIIKPTKIFPTRSKVEYINRTALENLETKENIFNTKKILDLPITIKQKEIRSNFSPEQIDTELHYLENNLLCDATVKLKIGAQVMLIINMELEDGNLLCNGSQGIITGFSENNYPIVKFQCGIERTMERHIWQSETIPGIGVAQVPLILAWALTIHKAQGTTLEIAEIDVGSGVFECGQTYVALSRIKSLEGLYLKSFDASKIRIHKKVREFYEKIK
jgi:ATP-dependent DNA helicase PIF1